MTPPNDRQAPQNTPKQSYTFTTEQLVAWSKKQEEWMATPAWVKTQEGRDAYKMAMRHLRYYVKNPIQEII